MLRLAGVWTGFCVLLMLFGFVFLVPSPDPNDLFATLAAPTDGDVALLAFALWLVGVVLLLTGVGIRRLRSR